MEDRRSLGAAGRNPSARTWVRVRNRAGHEFDVQKGAVRAGMTPIEGVPEYVGQKPRRPNFHGRTKKLVDLAGQPAKPRRTHTGEGAGQS